MRRRLFNVAAAVSLVLCAATAALWAQSYVSPRGLKSYALREGYQLASERGGFGVLHLSSMVGEPVLPGGAASGTASQMLHSNFAFTITEITRYFWGNPPLRGHFVSVRYWVLLLLSIILCGVASRPMVARHRRKHRLVHGRCTSCGYDLRATPDHCPECGTVAEQAAVGAR